MSEPLNETQKQNLLRVLKVQIAEWRPEAFSREELYNGVVILFEQLDAAKMEIDKLKWDWQAENEALNICRHFLKIEKIKNAKLMEKIKEVISSGELSELDKALNEYNEAGK
jgi:uncharacterized NAD(P)/FAD-binding protein YdhS